MYPNAMFDFLKPPYRRIDFEYWANACYNLTVLAVAGIPVVAVSNEYSLVLKIVYSCCLILATIVLIYFGKKLSYLMDDFDKEN